MSHVQEESATPTVGRRAVTRGAVWSVPAVTLAVAAPASAATSGCTVRLGKLDWDLFASGSTQLNKVLLTTIGEVTVTITVTGDHAPTNGVVTSATTGGQSKAMRFYDQENKADTSQTITITFSKEVQNVSFALLDVDSKAGWPRDAYQDEVIVLTPGWTGVKHSNVKGSGTASDPYRGRTTDSPVDGSSSKSNVDLSWAGKLSSVSFRYAQDGKVDGAPYIGISDISFETVC